MPRGKGLPLSHARAGLKLDRWGEERFDRIHRLQGKQQIYVIPSDLHQSFKPSFRRFTSLKSLSIDNGVKCMEARTLTSNDTIWIVTDDTPQSTSLDGWQGSVVSGSTWSEEVQPEKSASKGVSASANGWRQR